MNNFIIGTIFSTLFISFLYLLESSTRKYKLNKDNTRRIAHVFSGFFGLFMGLILNPEVFIFYSLIFLLIILISFRKKYFSSIHTVKRKTFGELFLPLGILTAYVLTLSNQDVFIASVLLLTICDPLSGFVIDKTGNKLKGSFLFFICTFIILLFMFGANVLISVLIIAFLLVLVERLSSYGLDNFTIPLASVLLINILL